jgi:hypothetical protein
LLKKIQFNLLLPDLALQLLDATASHRQIRGIGLGSIKHFARPARRTQRFRSAAAEMPAPLVNMASRYLQLPRQRAGIFPSQ